MTSEGNHPRNNGDRLKFLVAIMTKDYENALKIGSSVLKQNPNDSNILEVLSRLRDKIAINSLAESSTDESDEDTSDDENMQTDCETTTESDSDSDTDDQTKKDVPTTTDTQGYHRNHFRANSLPKRIQRYLLSQAEKDPNKNYNEQKIYRVLALNIHEKEEFPARSGSGTIFGSSLLSSANLP